MQSIVSIKLINTNSGPNIISKFLKMKILYIMFPYTARDILKVDKHLNKIQRLQNRKQRTSQSELFHSIIIVHIVLYTQNHKYLQQKKREYKKT